MTSKQRPSLQAHGIEMQCLSLRDGWHSCRLAAPIRSRTTPLGRVSCASFKCAILVHSTAHVYQSTNGSKQSDTIYKEASESGNGK